MLYREAGQFKTTYIGDQELFPVKQDRWGIFVIIGIFIYYRSIDSK